MTRPIAHVLFALVAVCFASCSAGGPPRERAPSAALVDPRVEARIDALLGEMTLEEKLGQLNQFSYRDHTGPATERGDYRELIAAGRIGSILNATGPARVNELQRIAVERSRLKIPILFGLDVIHGYWTTFPVPLAMSATWDTQLAERAAAVAAREASADGIRWTFSPMVDIARDPRWGRIVEGAGEDPYLGAAFARAYVRGYQGRDPADPSSIAACAKHYVGYGAAEGGRDYNTTEISERTLRDVYLPPFKAAADAGALTFMSAFNAINGVPATANRHTLDQVLRKEWGFRGFVVSDWTGIKETIEHGTATDGAVAARGAILAGLDMDMESALYLNELANEVKAGRVPIGVIDESVRRVLRVKFAVGLFDRPYAPPRDEKDTPPPLEPADIALARTCAEQSFVLLKNTAAASDAGRDPILPLSLDVRTIALIGPLADAAEDMLGAWDGRGRAEHVVTLSAAMEQFARQRGITLLYEKGTEFKEAEDTPATRPAGGGIAAAVAAARRADVVVLAVGESRDMSGEAASRTRLDLPGDQPELLDALAETGKPIVMIVFSGRPLVLTPYVDKTAAVVQAWHPGIQGGPALARVLCGEADFSGRLTVSFPRALGQLPLYYNHLNTGRPVMESTDPSRPPRKRKDRFLSRYLDEENEPLYPFGYGLSYATFDFSKPRLSAAAVDARELNAGTATVRVTADVRNTGDRDGVTVAQLYIRQRGTSVSRPVRELKGFARVPLAPGESRQVEFTLGREELAFWNVDMKHVVEPSQVAVWIGPDSRAGEGVELSID